MSITKTQNRVINPKGRQLQRTQTIDVKTQRKYMLTDEETRASKSLSLHGKHKAFYFWLEEKLFF